MERITSKDNRHIKEYCKLNASKKQRDITGLFPVEGLKLTLEAYDNSVRIEKVFLTEYAGQKYREKLFELLNSGVTVMMISEELACKMSDTDTPQGVFALCAKLDKSLLADKIEKKGIYAALSGLQDPGNMGTIFRTAEAVGIKGIFVSADCCDVYSPKVIRAAMGSVFRLPFLITKDLGGDLKQFSKQGLKSYAAVLDKEAESLTDIDFKGSGIAVIGNEGNGLDKEMIACCDHKLTIRMKGNTESLNAAMAAGIILWQMTQSEIEKRGNR